MDRHRHVYNERAVDLYTLLKQVNKHVVLSESMHKKYIDQMNQ
jgi:hypothetical protein